MERRRASPDMAAPGRGGERDARKRQVARGAETVAGLAVGPARSSADPPAWRGGAGSEGAGLLVALFVSSTGSAGRSVMDELRPDGRRRTVPGAAGRQAVRGDRVRGLVRLAAGEGQQGSAGGGRAVHRGLRGAAGGQPLQDLEPDVGGDVVPAAGEGGGDPQAGRRHQDARGADDRRPRRADRGREPDRDRGGGVLPPRTPTVTGPDAGRTTRSPSRGNAAGSSTG